jgi:hypothetical protein
MDFKLPYFSGPSMPKLSEINRLVEVDAMLSGVDGRIMYLIPNYCIVADDSNAYSVGIHPTHNEGRFYYLLSVGSHPKVLGWFVPVRV